MLKWINYLLSQWAVTMPKWNKLWNYIVCQSKQRRLWQDCLDVQACLSLCFLHLWKVLLSHRPAHFLRKNFVFFDNIGKIFSGKSRTSITSSKTTTSAMPRTTTYAQPHTSKYNIYDDDDFWFFLKQSICYCNCFIWLRILRSWLS